MRFRYRQVPQLAATTTPGLFEQVTGKPLPSYKELRAIYGDPADLPPILPQHREALSAGGPVPPALHGKENGPEMFVAVHGPEVSPLAPGHVIAQQVNEAAAVLRDAVGVSATKVGKVDFRDMLKDDGPAWSVRSRLEKVLGRAYLATALADQLDPETAVRLADRLDKLVEQAVADHELATAQQVAAAVTAKVQEYRESRETRTEAVTHERFGRASRFD